MTASLTFIGKFIALIIVAVCIFAVIYFMFPDVFESVFPGQASAEDTIQESISRLEQSMGDLELNREDIAKVMDQIDTETIQRVIRESAVKGVETGGQFFDMIKERVDFGTLDTAEIRNIYVDKTQDIDFSSAFRQLGEATERGLFRLADSIRELFSR